MIKKHTFSLLPILRQNKKNKNGDAPVYVRLTVDGKRTEISTKMYVAAERWNAKKGRVKGPNEYCHDFSTAQSRCLNKSLKKFTLA